MIEGSDWASASDLAEYSYCPRAHWYREHSPAGFSPRGSVRSLRRGQRFHRQELGGELRREAHAGAYVALVLIGIALVVAALYLGGLR